MYTIYIYWETGESDKCKADTYEQCMEIASSYKFAFGGQVVGYDIVREWLIWVLLRVMSLLTISIQVK